MYVFTSFPFCMRVCVNLTDTDKYACLCLPNKHPLCTLSLYSVPTLLPVTIIDNNLQHLMTRTLLYDHLELEPAQDPAHTMSSSGQSCSSDSKKRQRVSREECNSMLLTNDEHNKIIPNVADNNESQSETSLHVHVLEGLQNEIMFMILSFLTDDSLKMLGKEVLPSFGLASRSCHRVCIGFVQNTPMTDIEIHQDEQRQTIMIYHWLVQKKVKIRDFTFYLEIKTVSTIGLNIIQQVAMSCDLTKLMSLEIKGLRTIPTSLSEKVFIKNGLELGMPFSVMDEWYPVHAAITEKSAALEFMEIFITKETFYRPILSKFAGSLMDLRLGIFSVCNQVKGNANGSNNQFQEISEAIENMPNLKDLHLWDMADESFIHSKKSIIIQSESLRTLKLDFLFLEACVCPSLYRLHCADVSLLNIDGNIEDFTVRDYTYGCCTFKAGVKSIKMVGIDVPDNCEIKIEVDPDEDPADFGYMDQLMMLPYSGED